MQECEANIHDTVPTDGGLQWIRKGVQEVVVKKINSSGAVIRCPIKVSYHEDGIQGYHLGHSCIKAIANCQQCSSPPEKPDVYGVPY